MAVRIERILCTVLHEAYERQVEEAMRALSEGLEGYYKRGQEDLKTARTDLPVPVPFLKVKESILALVKAQD
jgi:hypothetical protein